MKFYKRFPGDINIKTGHLTPSQFGCYDRLLDHYYATEKPIPANGAHSICRAVTASDRHACDTVLGEFFHLTGAGWEQQRAEEMIAEAQPKIEAARVNGLKGGRPVGSKKKPTGLISGTEEGDSEKASQSQSNSPTSNSISKPSASHPPAEGMTAEFDEFWQAWPKGERKQDKAKCLDHWKRNNLTAIGALILADVRVKRGTVKWAEGFIEAPLVYLRGKRWEDGVVPDAPGAHQPAVTVADNPGLQKTQAYIAQQDAHGAAAAQLTDEEHAAISARLAHAREVAASAAARTPLKAVA